MSNRCLCGLLVLLLVGNVALAQQEKVRDKGSETDNKALIDDTKITKLPGRVVESDDRLEKFKKLMTGAKLTGLFTIEGKPLKDQNEETYEIRKVERPEGDPAKIGDKWIITARVKYGTNDYELPFPIDVKWAGETPVLTLEKLAVPGMGVFSARVVLHGNKYAGTWAHDNVSGHLFGKIAFAEEQKPDTSSERKP
jgi:hypothetical protein